MVLINLFLNNEINLRARVSHVKSLPLSNEHKAYTARPHLVCGKQQRISFLMSWLVPWPVGCAICWFYSAVGESGGYCLINEKCWGNLSYAQKLRQRKEAGRVGSNIWRRAARALQAHGSIWVVFGESVNWIWSDYVSRGKITHNSISLVVDGYGVGITVQFIPVLSLVLSFAPVAQSYFDMYEWF